MGTSASKTNSHSRRNGTSLRDGVQFLAHHASNYHNGNSYNSHNAYEGERPQNYAGGCSDVEDFAYQGAMEEYSGGYNGGYNGGNDSDDYDGGCGCRAGIIGADELDTTTVKDYSNSVNSKTKDKIIEEIINVGLKLGLKITGDTQQDKIKSLLAEIPAGDRFKKNDEVHKKTCIGIANAINSIHGNIIISTDLPPEVICQHVSEIVSSLSAGMHTEFLAVYNDVRKVLKNLHVLKEALFEDHAQIIERIKNSDDATLPQQVTTLNDLHKILTDEIDRQIQLLSNLLNVTLFPSEKNLASLIKNKKDIHGYIEKIDVKIGSDKFGHVISDVLKGLGLTANFALIIERALKTVGITLDEYAKSGNLGTLRTTITRKLLDKKLDENQLHEYLSAADLLYKNFYRHEDIAKKLENKTGQHEHYSGQHEHYSEKHHSGKHYSGGEEHYAKTTVDKRVSDRKALRNLIFTAFYKQLNGLFDQFVASLDHLTMKVGTEIPLSDQLDGFRQILQRVNGELIRNKHIYYALIGYYNDAMSKSKKDALVGDLKMISSYIDTILEMDMYKPSARYFQTVQGHIKAMIDIIDNFSDEIAAKFGRSEDADPQCMYLEKMREDGEDEKEGGYDQLDSIAGGIDPMSELVQEPVIKFKSTKSIHDAIRQFDYMYRVAQIRYNLSATGKELAHYSEKYEKIVANSIADILTHDKKIYHRLRKELDPEHSGKPVDFVTAGMKGFTTEKAVKDEHDAARKFLDAQWETKKKFWTTIEAVDTYMRVFTDAIVKNPNDIREIKSMIDEIDVIGDWYSDATGEDLTAIFEYFPSYMHGDSVTDAGTATAVAGSLALQQVTYPPDIYKNRTDRTHYYSRIAAKLQEVGGGANPNIALCLPGNPYLVTVPTNGDEAKIRAKKMFTGLAVLKNLLSVFINVGSKFGGEELRKKVFMTPAQMYNNLIDYLQASAFTQGWGVGELTTDSELGSEFFDSNYLSFELDIKTGEVVGNEYTTRGSTAFASGERTYTDNRFVHLGVSASKQHDIYANVREAVNNRAAAQYAANSLMPTINTGLSAVDANLIGELNTSVNSIQTQLAALAPPAAAIAINPTQGVLHPSNYLAPVIGPLTVTNANRALLFKKRWGVWMRSVIQGVRDREGFGFKREDDYFVLALKSIAAKIFTVTGMYDVLDRPMEFNGLNPVRMSIGGADEFPKVESSAVALYLRLPLLAKFYRGIFGWDDKENYETYSDIRKKDTNVKISMVPDIDGVFSGLIRLIFRKTKFVDTSAYGDEDVKEIIKEVNLIHQRMSSKYKQNVVMETIHEFVAEMNRRYGVVSQNDRNAYETEFGHRYDYSRDPSQPVQDRYNEAPDTEIAILPGETDDEIERPSATQRLLGDTFDSKVKTHPFTITKQHRDLVYKFRCAIDKYFENPDEEYTFNNAIKAAQMKLKNEAYDEKRFKIITSLVRGVDIYSKVDGMKHILFHETVVSGLNVLSGVHSMLARFKLRAHLIDMSGIEDQIWEYFMIDGTKDLNGLKAHIREYITKLGIAEPSVNLSALVDVLFGYGEAFVCNGGHVDSNVDPNAIKAVDGIRNGAAGAPLFAARFPVNNNFGVIHVPQNTTPHPSFIDKHGHLVTNDHVGGAAADPLANAHGGLASVISGYSIEQLRAAYKTAHNGGRSTPKSLVADTFIRFIFNREYVMKELLESLFGLGNDFQGLVTVSMDDGRLHIGYGGLKTLIEDMFQHVSYFIDLLRPHVKPELIAQYTEKLSPGSFYWLQEQLMEKIIIGRPEATSTLPGESSPRVGYTSIDELMHRLTYSYEFLTREWEIDGTAVAAAANGDSGSNTAVAKSKNRTKYDKVFAQMIFYDASCPHSGIIRSIDTASQVDIENNALNAGSRGGVKIVEYLHNSYDALHFSGPAGNKMIDTRYAARFHQLYSWKNEFTLNRSALFSFNQLIAKYIQSFYDTVSGKMYIGLINQFANGVFNRSIVDQLNTYPDTVPLLNFKFNAASDIKVPPTHEITLFNNADLTSRHEVFQQLLKLYLTYGLDRTYLGNSAKLSKLLDVSAPLNTTVRLKTFNNAVEVRRNTHAIYVYLLAYGVAMTVHKLFITLEQPVPGGGAALQDVDVVGGANPRFTADVRGLLKIGESANIAATYGEIRTMYSGSTAVPSFQNIIYKIITNGITAQQLADKLTYAIVINNRMMMENRFSIIMGADGVASTTHGMNVLEPLKNLLNRSLKVSSPNGMANGATRADVLLTTMRLFPFDEVAVGRTSDELNYQVSLFSSLFIRAAEIALEANITQAQFETKIKALIGTVNKSSSTYAPGTTAQPKYLVKYEEMLSANTDYFKADGINKPLGDANYLVVARGEMINGVNAAESIKEIGRSEIQHPPSADELKKLLNFGNRADPDTDHVLFTSLSVILKNMLQSRSQHNQSLLYIQDSVADIALYMKEKMRANLPSFKNLFKELLNRCEFLKKMMSQSDMDLTRSQACTGRKYGLVDYSTGRVNFNNPWPYVLKPPTNSSDDTKNRFTGILDSIIRGCAAFITSCDQVLREIGDDPKYFELYQNSIKDYKTQYGVDPLMPLSSTLAVFKNSNDDTYMDFFPIHSLGEDSFKFMYGTRTILGQPGVQPLLEHNPGFISLIEQFNLITDGKFQADKSRADSFHKTFVKLLRYVHELKHVKGIITPYLYTPYRAKVHANSFALTDQYHGELQVGGLFTRDDLVVSEKLSGSNTARTQTYDPNATTHHGAFIVSITNKSDMSLVADGFNHLRTNSRKYPLPVYSIAKTLNETIKLTESSFKEDKIKELVMYLTNENKKRNSLEIQNIIDLNIVPINVHALMREIPLANLYNYAYTFDRMIIELYYGLKNDNARKLISELCDRNNTRNLQRIHSAKDMLVALLIDPYMNLWEDKTDDPVFENYYEKYAKGMLMGVALNGELGRPKFLSDQIYNKAVFGEVYPSQSLYNEVGPPASASMRSANANTMISNVAYYLAAGCVYTTWGRQMSIFGDTQTIIINMIIQIIIDKPHIKFDELHTQVSRDIITKFPAADVVPAGAAAALEGAAILYTFACKISFWGAANIVKAARSPGYSMDKFNIEWDYYTIARSLIRFLGLDASMAFLAMQPHPTNKSTMAWQLSDGSLQGVVYPAVIDISQPVATAVTRANGMRSVNAANFTFDQEHLASFRKLASELATDVSFPTLVGGVANTAVNNTFGNYGSQSYQATNTNVKTDNIHPTQKLHWLDVVNNTSDYEPRPGVDLQNSPAGDNYNVLDSNQVKSANVGEIAHILSTLGRLRFDTVLIRNLIFVVNLYRSVRMKLQRDLVYNKDIVQRSASITNSQLTEFYGNQVDQDRQSYDKAFPQRWARYNY